MKSLFRTLSGKEIEPSQRMNPYQMMILGGMQDRQMFRGLLGGPGYKPDKVKKRRAKNKVARRQRKINAAHH